MGRRLLRQVRLGAGAGAGGVMSHGMVCSSVMLGWTGGGGATSAALLPDTYSPGGPPPASRPRMDGA